MIFFKPPFKNFFFFSFENCLGHPEGTDYRYPTAIEELKSGCTSDVSCGKHFTQAIYTPHSFENTSLTQFTRLKEDYIEHQIKTIKQLKEMNGKNISNNNNNNNNTLLLQIGTSPKANSKLNTMPDSSSNHSSEKLILSKSPQPERELKLKILGSNEEVINAFDFTNERLLSPKGHRPLKIDSALGSPKKNKGGEPRSMLKNILVKKGGTSEQEEIRPQSAFGQSYFILGIL